MKDEARRQGRETGRVGVRKIEKYLLVKMKDKTLSCPLDLVTRRQVTLVPLKYN